MLDIEKNSGYNSMIIMKINTNIKREFKLQNLTNTKQNHATYVLPSVTTTIKLGSL